MFPLGVMITLTGILVFSFKYDPKGRSASFGSLTPTMTPTLSARSHSGKLELPSGRKLGNNSSRGKGGISASAIWGPDDTVSVGIGNEVLNIAGKFDERLKATERVGTASDYVGS